MIHGRYIDKTDIEGFRKINFKTKKVQIWHNNETFDIMSYLILFGKNTKFREEKMEYLLEKIFDINEYVSDGCTMLSKAICIYDIGVCEFLLSKGANINQKGRYGNVLLFDLFIESARGTEEGRVPKENKEVETCFRFLIENGADLNFEIYETDITNIISDYTEDMKMYLEILKENEHFLTEEKRRKLDGMRLRSLL